MKSITYDELKEYVKKEMLTPNNPKIVRCHSKYNPKRILTFLIANDDYHFFRPWRGYPEIIEKGDYINTDTQDIYNIKSYAFKECYIVIPSTKEPQ